jgi:sulfoquinovose isomerase
MTYNPAEWMTSVSHRAFLMDDAEKQYGFFDNSLRPDAGFYVLDQSGRPIDSNVQELHTTTRLVHSYALGKIAGRGGCDKMIDQGMRYLRSHHKDSEQGGYFWSLEGRAVKDGRKLAYGHAFVLLAASSALAANHPDAQALLADVDRVLDAHFWEEDRGLFCDEWNRDWTPFSSYRGMNANMHGTEALLAAYEATGREKFLHRAGRILNFFVDQIAPKEGWRLPEHYTENWEIDREYSENPMFRPAGTTPGHSFELARLLLQFNELLGEGGDAERVDVARKLIYRALSDAWDAQRGGFVYTLKFGGAHSITDRYWWPVTEAIGALAALLKLDPKPEDADWYRRLWDFAQISFIDSAHGGWFPEIDVDGKVVNKQFVGKPDLYHSVQAALLPLTPRVSNAYKDLANMLTPSPTASGLHSDASG